MIVHVFSRLLKCKIFVALVFIASFTKVTSYEIYYLEEICPNGDLTMNVVGTGSESSGILQSSRHTSYSLQMSCKIHLVAPPKHYVLVSLREVGFRAKFDGSCLDYLEIDRPMCKHVYSLDEEHHYHSLENNPPNVMNLYYHTSEGLDNKTMSGYPGFTLTFTVFQKASEMQGGCGSKSNSTNTFRCKNGYCIWSGLICDGHNNCADLSDEDSSGSSACETAAGSTALIILAVVIVFLLIIMCVATLLCSKNAAVRRFSTRLRSRTLSFIPKFPLNR